MPDLVPRPHLVPTSSRRGTTTYLVPRPPSSMGRGYEEGSSRTPPPATSTSSSSRASRLSRPGRLSTRCQDDARNLAAVDLATVRADIALTTPPDGCSDLHRCDGLRSPTQEMSA
mgnify:CR=1 FL=1